MRFSGQRIGRVIAAALSAGMLLIPSHAGADVPATPQNVDWRYYGNDQANTRYQNVDQINRDNVAKLKPAWVFHTGVLDPDSSFEASPIVVDGTMYVTTGKDDVFALDAATGAQKWAYHPADDMPPLEDITICCGEDNRGVAYGDGKVFIGRLDNQLVALDAKTGTVAWKATVADWKHNFSITMAPQFADHKVIVSMSGGDYQTRGSVQAYDSRTGKLSWRFYTTEKSTWEGDSWKTGGGNVWGNPTVDARLGLVYLGTGNPGPDLYGGARGGKNLYGSALVAVDLQTGKVRWAFQEVHHDLWDYDAPQPPMLFDVHRNGRDYQAVGHCNKDGEYFILDRATGEPIYPVTEVPVPTQPAWQKPWPTQPVSAVESLATRSVKGPVLPGITAAPRFTPPQQEELAMQPGGVGGCGWPAPAHSPRTGYLYYSSIYFPFVYLSSPSSGPTNTGGSSEEAPIPGAQLYTTIGATNANTGRIAWSQRIPQVNSVHMAVAGDVLFYGTDDGVFHGVNSKTGTQLWSFDGTTVPNGGGAAAPPSVYVTNGREYVVEAFGGNYNDRFSSKSPVGDAVVAFTLPDDNS